MRKTDKEEFLREYFDRDVISKYCKKTGITVERYKEMAKKILEKWEIDGVTHVNAERARVHLRTTVEAILQRERSQAEEKPTQKKRSGKTTEAKPKREMNYDDTDFGSIDK